MFGEDACSAHTVRRPCRSSSAGSDCVSPTDAIKDAQQRRGRILSFLGADDLDVGAGGLPTDGGTIGCHLGRKLHCGLSGRNVLDNRTEWGA